MVFYTFNLCYIWMLNEDLNGVWLGMLTATQKVPGKSWSFSEGLALDWQSSLVKINHVSNDLYAELKKSSTYSHTWLGPNPLIGSQVVNFHWTKNSVLHKTKWEKIKNLKSCSCLVNLCWTITTLYLVADKKYSKVMTKMFLFAFQFDWFAVCICLYHNIYK
jgi:hypothetical protein